MHGHECFFWHLHVCCENISFFFFFFVFKHWLTVFVFILRVWLLGFVVVMSSQWCGWWEICDGGGGGRWRVSGCAGKGSPGGGAGVDVITYVADDVLLGVVLTELYLFPSRASLQGAAAIVVPAKINQKRIIFPRKQSSEIKEKKMTRNEPWIWGSLDWLLPILPPRPRVPWKGLGVDSHHQPWPALPAKRQQSQFQTLEEDFHNRKLKKNKAPPSSGGLGWNSSARTNPIFLGVAPLLLPLRQFWFLLVGLTFCPLVFVFRPPTGRILCDSNRNGDPIRLGLPVEWSVDILQFVERIIAFTSYIIFVITRSEKPIKVE